MDWDKLPGLVLSSPQCTRSQQKVRGVQRNVHAREVNAKRGPMKPPAESETLTIDGRRLAKGPPEQADEGARGGIAEVERDGRHRHVGRQHLQ